jgi:hypothetical protein
MTGKMLPCYACCPAGVDSYSGRHYPAGKSRHEITRDDKGRLTWQCGNCGNVKVPRATRLTTDYEFVTKLATTAEGMSAANRARFNYFNPNGAYAVWKAAAEKIDAYVDAHPEQPNGVLFVHGSLNDWPHKLISKAAMAKTTKRFDVFYAEQICREYAAKAEAWLTEKGA